jgi:aryl-alcohol dehydrogenase-like predicted oxidoreductase
MTPAQIALAWLLAHRGRGSCRSCGTTKQGRLTENVGGASVELTPADLRDIEGAVAQVDVQGARYPEHLQKMVGR